MDKGKKNRWWQEEQWWEEEEQEHKKRQHKKKKEDHCNSYCRDIVYTHIYFQNWVKLVRYQSLFSKNYYSNSC
jgi:hypothetical protein